MAQLLAAPVVLEPELDVPPEALELVVLEAAGAVSALGLSALLLSPDLLSPDLLSLAPSLGFLALLYRSAYQPPPFKMKPAPPET
jgi:hypothetical protein